MGERFRRSLAQPHRGRWAKTRITRGSTVRSMLDSVKEMAHGLGDDSLVVEMAVDSNEDGIDLMIWASAKKEGE